MIRVVIADDQALVRQGLRALLELSNEVVVIGEASNGDEAFQVIRRTQPDVALLDVRMPGATGLEVLEALTHTGVQTFVILLTTFDDKRVVQESARLGAHGYLLKDVSFDQLIGTIRAVAAGENRIALLGEEARERLRTYPPTNGLEEPILTAREEDVLHLMSAGLSNREIAKGLKLSEGTIKNRVSDILSKLGVRNRTQAVIQAARTGLL